MTERRLGVGLIGAHTWAEKAHLPGYKAHERVDLVAICDVMPERARAMAAKFGARRSIPITRRCWPIPRWRWSMSARPPIPIFR